MDSSLIACVISELARNIFQYAGHGTITLEVALRKLEVGLLVIASDAGPGIENVARALEDGFSTSRGLGLGLPGVRRVMDDFEIESAPGKGTTVRATKWLRGARPNPAGWEGN